jgi:molybdenum cofactor guanylyltransferase
MNCGGIVLCGGRSSRMGLPKPALPFGPESMLERVVRLLGQAVKEIVVVVAPRQDLPDLPPGTRIVRDRREGRGPLEGLRAGLSALPEECEAAYVTGCDVPGLVPAFVARMFDLLGDHSIAVPVSGDRPHPLSAVYRRSVLDTIDRLLAGDHRRLTLLFDLVPTRRVSTTELADVDPELATLNNLNSPFVYLEALAHAGLTAPADLLARLKPEKGRPGDQSSVEESV